VAQVVVCVKPGSRKPGITVVGSTIEIRVSDVPQDGRANEAVRALLATALDIPRSRVTLLRGTRAKQKTFEIDGWDREAIVARLLQYHNL
jgi:uncharacterized protein YggU (UPF0235/DUF167 family)